MMEKKHRHLFLTVLLIIFGSIILFYWISLPSVPPEEPTQACKIFEQYPEWYEVSKNVEKQWGVPVSVQLAILYQESTFQATAHPSKPHLFSKIRWFHHSTAVGFAQVKADTWQAYQKETGNWHASRENYEDAVEFMGWYIRHIHKELGIPLSNAKLLYLAYHEGIHGYQSQSYLSKPWLIKVAEHVQDMSIRYRNQLAICMQPKKQQKSKPTAKK